MTKLTRSNRSVICKGLNRWTLHNRRADNASHGRMPFLQPLGSMAGLLMALASPVAVVAAPDVFKPVNNFGLFGQYGYPEWYQDATGVRVEPCLNANDPLCVLLPKAGVFSTANPLVFPSNFPDEFFYAVVDSADLTTSGCGTSSAGRARVRLALEGAFASGAPVPNEQMVFGRVRVTVTSGLCAGHVYRVTHPYGTSEFTADGDGAIKARDGTVDIGCVPTVATTCDFTQALPSALLSTGLLRWDPAVAPAAPAGYLGDPAVAHTIVGGTNNGVSFFDVTDNVDVPGLSSNLFNVSGKIAGPLLADRQTLDLGGVVQATTNTRSLTITNAWNTPITITGLTVGGTNAAEFTATGCTGSLAPDATCIVNVSFTPGATVTGPRAATLQLAHDGLRSPLTLSLAGTALSGTDQRPVLQVTTPNGANPPFIDFGRVRVTTLSSFQDVTLTNTGSAPLQVLSATITASSQGQITDVDAFRVGNNSCAGVFVAANNSCKVGLGFQPTNARDYVANLTLVANTENGPVTVNLIATGTGGVAAVSTDTSSFGFPAWYRDEAGFQLGQCIDPTDPLCIVLPDDFYTGGALNFPSNFPSEFFYFVADSDIIATPGCAGSPPGKAFVRMADEAAFGSQSGGPEAGWQMVFGRIRIVVTSGLCPNTEYTFTHPYGQDKVTTDNTGAIRRNAATTDIGCFPTVPNACDFKLALASPVLGGYLRQSNAPVGYLGSPNLLAKVTGAPFIAPGETANANYFRIQGPNGLDLKTELFTVMGKFNGPVSAIPAALNFDTVTTGSVSDQQEVTFINGGTTAIDASTTLLGPNASAFTVDNACNGNISPGGSCKVKLAFAPSATGVQTATLRLSHNGLNQQTDVTLVGTGGAVIGNAAISVSPGNLNFVDLKVGQTSASATVKVSNAGGTAPLQVGSGLVLSGINPTSFTVKNNCADAVAVNASCTIDVQFTPSVAGEQTATLSIPSNAGPDVTVTLNGRGASSGAVPRQSSSLTASGFPTWYQDDNGVRIEPCLDPNDLNCVVLADATFNPANPVVFPTNFPMEFFYSIVDSNSVTVPATDCGGRGGTVQLRLALEGTFTSPQPQAGAQTVFGRSRITGSGFCPNFTYFFDTPWGRQQVNADGFGKIKSTIDQPNVLANAPLNVGVLRWDPNVVGPAAPTGYLGDAVTFHKVVGSRYRPTATDEPVNYFRARGQNLNVGTDEFLVSGKLAGPIITDIGALDFGSVQVGNSSAVRSVAVTNIGNTVIGGFSPSVSANFRIMTSTCNGVTLPPDATTACRIDVRYDAAASAATTDGTLTLGYNGTRSPVTVALRGTTVEASKPSISLSTASLNFAAQEVKSQSAVQTIVVSNTGQAPLTVSSSSSGSNTGDFLITDNNCTVNAVAAGSSCSIAVRFAPSGTANLGTRTAKLTILSNDTVKGPQDVTLSGTATAAMASVSPTSLSLTTGATGSTTQTVKLTNTGTANLNLVTPVFTLTPVGTTLLADMNKFRLNNSNCNNVAPGRSCSVNVSFTPALPKNTGRGATYQATLAITTNAVNVAGGVLTVGLRANVN